MITTTVSGYLYNAAGQVVKVGTLTLRLQQDMTSVDGFKVAPFVVSESLLPLATPAAPGLFNIGTPGSTSYTYYLTALDGGGGETVVSTGVTTATGAATLNSANYNRLTWFRETGVVTYKVYGRSGGTPQLLGTASSFIDAGVEVMLYEDKGTTLGAVAPTANTSGGYVTMTVVPTVGASPSGLAYKVEYDPDPTDTTQPPRTKTGYWLNYWAVPNTGAVPLGDFVTARRGQPLTNYIPLNGTIARAADILTLGAAVSTTNKRIQATQVGKTPEIRYNETTDQWELSNDGITFLAIGTPSAGAFTNIIAGTGLTGGGTSGAVTLNIATQSQPAWLTSVAWSVVSKTSSSLADLATRSATDLTSGTLPNARFPATLPAASAANLTSIPAANLTGSIADARLSANIPRLDQGATAAFSLGLYAETTLSGQVAFQARNLDPNGYGAHVQGGNLSYNMKWSKYDGTMIMLLDGPGILYTQGGTVSVLSDLRHKTRVGTFTAGLEAIRSLAPAMYVHNADSPASMPRSLTPFVGLGAQDVRHVIPEAVNENAEGVLSLSQGPIVYALLNAVKELDDKLNDLTLSLRRGVYR